MPSSHHEFFARESRWDNGFMQTLEVLGSYYCFHQVLPTIPIHFCSASVPILSFSSWILWQWFYANFRSDKSTSQCSASWNSSTLWSSAFWKCVYSWWQLLPTPRRAHFWFLSKFPDPVTSTVSPKPGHLTYASPTGTTSYWVSCFIWSHDSGASIPCTC